MARKRQIDPEFFIDEEISELTSWARLFYIGTWCYAEDTGVIEVRFKTLKYQIFPHDYFEETEIESFYQEVKSRGFLIEYAIDRKRLCFIKAFHKRQQIQYPSKSYLPLPPKPLIDMIPEKVRNNNKYKKCSMNIQCELIEGSQRIELNRKNRIERIEIDSLIKIFPKKQDLKRHLKNRHIDPEQTKEIIQEFFPDKK